MMRPKVRRLGAFVVASSLCSPLAAWGWNPFRTESRAVRSGNRALASKNYDAALRDYERAARELPDDAGVSLNRGLAHYRKAMAMPAPPEGQADEGRARELSAARDAFLQATRPGGARDLRADGYYNLGNAFFQERKFRDAIEAFRQSLRIRPAFRDAQWNLELAMRMQQEEEERQRQQQEQQEQQPQQQQPQQQQNQQQQQQQPDPQQQQQQDRQQQQQQQQQQPQAQDSQPPNQPRTPEEVEAVLDSLQQREDNLQRQRARLRGQQAPRRVERDW